MITNPSQPELQNLEFLKEHFQVIDHPEKALQTQQRLSSVLQFVEEETGSSDISVILDYISRSERQLGNTLKPDRLRRFQEFVTIRSQARNLHI
jgi:hypothetical protein